MAEKGRFEGGIGYYQEAAKDFTPITVSADFGALERLLSLKKITNASAFPEVATKVAKAA